ncbi:MAG TPA: hypothetical protein VL501_09695, partial [Pyrinomonadaceae bacterium]|nr:hypothetical protein [Pyrinomonadaceae bacterium]
MPSPDTQRIADKIAKLLEGESQAPEHAALFAAIEKINHRLDKIEASQQKAVTPQPSLINQQPSNHPSLDKLNIAEAIADAVFAGVPGMHKEKACQFEPGKPCDHCSM